MKIKSVLGDEEIQLSTRIDLAIRDSGGVNVVSVASETPASSLRKYMSGQILPSAIALRRIAFASKKPLDWFFGVEDKAKDKSLLGKIDAFGTEYINVPILDVNASAGCGHINEEPETIGYHPFTKSFLGQLGVSSEYARIIFARGDSMYPTIHDRALVLIDTNENRLIDGMIYTIATTDGLRLKRIQRQNDGGVILISDNKDIYLPEHISAFDAENISVVGRAFWTGKMI